MLLHQFMKKKSLVWLSLVVILILGFYFRIYHINYPVIGYHNWKETHYLTEARNFARNGFFKHGFFIPEWDYPRLKDDPSGAHSDTFPAISIIVGLAFKLFGTKLWIARLINIIFALGCVLFFYLIIKKVFEREDLALLSAALMSINPLLVFFGRQVQLINCALFFSLTGIYFYLRWLDNTRWKDMLLFTIFLALGFITKYSFVIFPVVAFCLFPFKKLKEKKILKQVLLSCIIWVLFLLWIPYSIRISSTVVRQVTTINLSRIFTVGFWKIVINFFKDNYTLTGFFLSLVGFFFFILFNKRKFGKKFFYAYLGISLVWFIILSEKLRGHNYHQYPIMPLVVFFIGYCFWCVSILVSKILRKKARYVIMLVLFILLLIPSIKAKNRMFDTQFFGLDIAGEYVKLHKKPGERAMHSSHQAYGFLWHADIKGTKGIPRNLNDLKYAEDKLNASWIFIYFWDFDILKEQIWGYISQNYKLVQFGFIKNKGEIQPYYLLLKKGGTFNFSQIDERLQESDYFQKTYELTTRKINFYFLNFE